MHLCLIVLGIGLVLPISSARADDLCGEAPTLSDLAMARDVPQAVFGLMISSAAGESFARHAANVYRELVEGRSLAAALLNGYCLKLTRGKDPWHVKDHFVGLSKLVPDFREAHNLLERIKTAVTRR